MQDAVRYAYFAPYPYEQHQTLIADCQSKPGVTLEMLGQTLDGHDLDLLRIGVLHREPKHISSFTYVFASNNVPFTVPPGSIILMMWEALSARHHFIDVHGHVQVMLMTRIRRRSGSLHGR